MIVSKEVKGRYSSLYSIWFLWTQLLRDRSYKSYCPSHPRRFEDPPQGERPCSPCPTGQWAPRPLQWHMHQSRRLGWDLLLSPTPSCAGEIAITPTSQQTHSIHTQYTHAVAQMKSKWGRKQKKERRIWWRTLFSYLLSFLFDFNFRKMSSAFTCDPKNS